MNKKLYNKLLNYDFKELFEKKNYAYFTKGEYNLNIIGVRANTGKNVTDEFDDFIVVEYKVGRKWTRDIYPITTDPGMHYMKKPLNEQGCAILVAHQYRGAYMIDKHNGLYEALCQRKPVRVFRDNNKNDVFDLDSKKTQEGIFGINIHRANSKTESKVVDKWSAGCQVFANPKDFAAFMEVCRTQMKKYGNSFTYTLLKERDL